MLKRFFSFLSGGNDDNREETPAASPAPAAEPEAPAADMPTEGGSEMPAEEPAASEPEQPAAM